MHTHEPDPQDDQTATPDACCAPLHEMSRRSMLTALGGAVAAVGFGGAAATRAAAAPPGPVLPGTQSLAGGVGDSGSLASLGATPMEERAPLELVLLGTQAGPLAEADRVGIATALVVNGSTYLIDCGRSAVTQYLRSGLTLASMKNIYLTHLHSDHVADYYNFVLFGVIPGSTQDLLTPVGVYGPGSAGGLPPGKPGFPLSTVPPGTPGTAAMTEALHHAYAYTSNIFIRDGGPADPRTLLNVHEIEIPASAGASFQNVAPDMEPFDVMEDDNVKVTATLVPHGPVFPSLAFRFDTEHGSVTFSGDTALNDNLPRLAAGTDTLVHEAINVRGANLPPQFVEHNLESHVEVQVVGGIAEDAGASRLVLTHIASYTGHIVTPLWHQWAQQGYGGEVIVGQDGQRIILA